MCIGCHVYGSIPACAVLYAFLKDAPKLILSFLTTSAAFFFPSLFFSPLLSYNHKVQNIVRGQKLATEVTRKEINTQYICGAMRH